MNLAAEERRHGGVVAYLSEVLSIAEFYARCSATFEEKQSDGTIIAEMCKPSEKWFRLQFWPANEHVRAAFQFTGRFPLKFQLQKKFVRKSHPHGHYCAMQKKLLKAW